MRLALFAAYSGSEALCVVEGTVMDEQVISVACDDGIFSMDKLLIFDFTTY